MPFHVFWLWAPLHFGDRFTHLALHEYEDGRRWLEIRARPRPRSPAGAAPWSTAGVRECHDIRYELEWEPGRREIKRAELWFEHPDEGEVHIEVEKVFTFRMRGIGYWHPQWGHGNSSTARLRPAANRSGSMTFDPTDFASIHLQNLVVAKMGDRRGVGVVEQIAIGPHRPTGLSGLFDGYRQGSPSVA